MENDRLLLTELATLLQKKPKLPDLSQVTEAAFLLKECRNNEHLKDRSEEEIAVVARSAASLLGRGLALTPETAIRDAWDIFWDAAARYDTELGGSGGGYGF